MYSNIHRFQELECGYVLGAQFFSLRHKRTKKVINKKQNICQEKRAPIEKHSVAHMDVSDHLNAAKIFTSKKTKIKDNFIKINVVPRGVG